MSVHDVSSRTRGFDVQVGWSDDEQSYWFAVYKSGSDEPSDAGGLDGELPSLQHLIAATEVYVRWDDETTVRHQLAEDPFELA